MKEQLCNPRKLLGETMLEIGTVNDSVVAVSCDSTNGGFAAFAEKYPERFIECGIAEQNAVSVCAGLSSMGFNAFIAVIDPFLTMRAYEQIRDDVGYGESNVKLFGTGSGLAYSTLGPSHEAIEDIAVLRTVPRLRILCPFDGESVRECALYAAEHKGPCYIRMPLQPFVRTLPGRPESNFEGRPGYFREEGDCLLLAAGTMVPMAVKAAGLLKERGVDAAVAGLLCVKPLRREEILAAARRYRTIISIEEHSVHGGLGTALAEILASSGETAVLRRIGIPEEGTVLTGNYEEVLDAYGLSAEKLAETIGKTLTDQRE